MIRDKIKKHGRSYLRAPIKGNILFSDDGYGLVAQCSNISEGGLLIENIPKYPSLPEISFMISVPRIPILSSLSTEKLFGLNRNDFKCDVIRLKGEMVRGANSLSEIDQVFTKYAGISFVNIGDDARLIIKNYVITSSKNLTYLLSLFNQSGSNNEGSELLRRVAMVLGYNQNEKLSLLRKVIINDYISLEEL